MQRKTINNHQSIRSSRQSSMLLRAIAPMLLLAATPAWGYDPLSSTFTIAAIPDPQYYAVVQWKNDQYYAGQMNWLVANKNTSNLAFVVGLGDNVQDGNPFNPDGSFSGNITPIGQPTTVTGAPSINTVDSVNHDFEAEWKRASADWDILGNANIPYYTVPGNHDYFHWDQKKNPNDEWLKYFNPATRYQGKSWFGGASPIDNTQPANLRYAGMNVYSYFFAGGYKFLNIGLQYVPTAGDLSWAQSIINANPGLPTIISTHDYQDTNGRDSAGNNIWNNLINKPGNSQVFMVLSGHVNGVHQQTSTDVDGKPVLEMLSDYQDMHFTGLQNGGDYLRTLSFNTAQNTIHVQTFSPVANNFLTTGTGAAANDFTLNFDFTQRFGPPPFLTGTTFFWDPGRTNASTGGGAGTWDAATTGNWYSGSADVAWSTAGASDVANFGGSAGAVTVAAAGVNANHMVFKTPGYSFSGGTITFIGTPTIDTTAGAASLANVLAGTSGLTVTGGAATLSGTNTFTGGIKIASGANLNFTADRNLGAAGGAVTLDGGTLNYSGNVSGGLTLSSRAITIGDNGATFNMPNAGTSPANDKLVLGTGSKITGAGDITKTGPGWLTIYSSNTAAGGNWNINGGVVEAGNANSLGTGAVTINNGGELADNVTAAIANPITVNTGATLGADFFNVTNTGTYSGPITANGNFNVRLGNFYSNFSEKVSLTGNITGAGTLSTLGPNGANTPNAASQVLTLAGDNSGFSGGITAATGTVVVGPTAGRPLGTGRVTLSGGKLALQGQTTQSGAATAIGPVAVSGFNKDVIYANPDVGGTTTSTLDGFFSFYQSQYIPPTGTLNAGTQLTGGLDAPDITSAIPNTVYQAKGQTVNTPFTLQSFTANNTLNFIQGSTGTLTLATPGVFSNLALLAASTHATTDTPNVTLHFTDGTSVTTQYIAYDWFPGTDTVKQAADIFGSAGIERYSPTQSPGWDQRPFAMYETDIDLTNINGVDYSSKQLASLTLNAAYTDAQGHGQTNIFALSGAARAWTVNPTAQTYANPVTVSADAGIDVSGALHAAMGTLNIGANKLSITSADTTASPYSLSFGATTLAGNAGFDVAPSAGNGPGTLALGPVSGSGSITKTNTGTLKLTAASAITGNLALNGGSVEIDGPTTAGSWSGNGTASLNIPGGSLTVAPRLTGNPTATPLAALSITAGGKLDLANNDLVIHNGDLSSVTALIKTGFNGGKWNGSGIASSTAASDAMHLTTLGVIQQSGNGSFDGQSVIAGDVLVKYTYYGDADLSGKVDGTDYSLIDHGFNTPGASGWINGDFNYDGKIDGSDYSLIDNAFNMQTTSLAAPANLIATATAEIAAPSAEAAAPAVPEPGSLAPLALGGGICLAARRRRARA
jgi:hypothetical protein